MSLTTLSLGLGRDRPRTAVEASGEQAVWRLDLRSVGYTGFAPPHEPRLFYLHASPVCFSENGVLIVNFLTREKVDTLARRDRTADPLPLRLHGIFLDAGTGKIRATKEWSTTPPTAGIIAAGGGRFVVITPALVESYSPELQPLNAFRPTPEQQSHLETFWPTPSGKFILAVFNNCAPHCDALPPSEAHKPTHSYQWLDTDSLQPQPAWSDWYYWSISDKQLAKGGGGYDRSGNLIVEEVLVRDKDGPWRSFCQVRAGYDGTECTGPEFISNEVLAMWGVHSLSLLPVGGGPPVLVARFPPDEWIGRWGLYSSADGKRLAVAVYSQKGGSALLDIDPRMVLKRVMVYDMPSRQWVYRLNAKRQKLKSISGLALSPDGTRMAILADGVVELYQLPVGSHDGPPGSH
jgi:hypothetical protein